MKWSLKLGKLLGIDVYLHFTFLLLAFLGFVYWRATHSAEAALLGVVFVIALFGLRSVKSPCGFPNGTSSILWPWNYRRSNNATKSSPGGSRQASVFWLMRNGASEHSMKRNSRLPGIIRMR